MAKSVDDRIKGFVGHFESVAAEIAELPGERAPLYREMLYVSILDALAKSVMPRRDDNKLRFVYFLKRFCRWPDGERVSLPHLYGLVTLNPDPAFEDLRQWAMQKYKSIDTGAITPITSDPSFDEVKKRWPQPSEHKTPIPGVDLETLTHYRLFYVYRSTLVHEMRRPGRGWNFSDSDEPHYHGLSDLDEQYKIAGTTVELVYPWKFFRCLCDTALKELRDYYTRNRMNPLDSFNLGTYWIAELNR